MRIILRMGVTSISSFIHITIQGREIIRIRGKNFRRAGRIFLLGGGKFASKIPCPGGQGNSISFVRAMQPDSPRHEGAASQLQPQTR
ncbi:MAG: hypothetical protein IJD99_11705 [Clostridia bacterium]|nr:hypothetical protein [Clostridia bacterium]